MKKILFAAAFALMYLGRNTSSIPPSDNAINFYTIYGWGAYTDSQYLNLFHVTISEMLKDLNRKVNFKHFKEEEKFYSAISQKGSHIAQVGNTEQFVTMIKKYKYRPVISYIFHDMKNNKTCLYVRGNSGINNITDLDGKTLAMSKTVFTYILLREMLMDKPETYFSNITLTGDTDAPAYTFYLEKQDAMFITKQQVKFLQLNNPEIVKGIKNVACSREHNFLALVGSQEVTDELVDQMVASLNKITSGEKVKQYYPLLKFLKVKITKTDAKSFAGIFELFDMAQQKGWINDYRKWLNSEETKKH